MIALLNRDCGTTNSRPCRLVSILEPVVVLCLFVSCASNAWAQTASLETRLKVSQADEGIAYVEQFEAPGSNPGETIKCTVSMNNISENEIVLRFAFKKGTANIGHHVHRESLSFQPTAIARRSAFTNTIYVTGWLERGQRVIVEEWVIGPLGIGVADPVGGGPSVTFLSQGVPSLTKRVIYLSDTSVAFRPISGIACHPQSDLLFLLEYSSPRAIHRLAIADGALEVDWLDFSSHPALTDPISLRAARHTARGHVIVALDHLPWEDSPFVNNPLQDTDPVAESRYLVIEDANLDGILDSTSEMSASAYDAYFSSGSWVKDHVP